MAIFAPAESLPSPATLSSGHPKSTTQKEIENRSEGFLPLLVESAWIIHKRSQDKKESGKIHKKFARGDFV